MSKVTFKDGDIIHAGTYISAARVSNGGWSLRTSDGHFVHCHTEVTRPRGYSDFIVGHHAPEEAAPVSVERSISSERTITLSYDEHFRLISLVGDAIILADYRLDTGCDTQGRVLSERSITRTRDRKRLHQAIASKLV